jgi:hypothetical protein
MGMYSVFFDNLEGASELAKKYDFNLGIPTGKDQSNRKFRLNRKFFAIVCQTSWPRKT